MSDYTLSAKITGDSKSFESAFIRAQNKMKSFDKKVKNMGANISRSGKNMMKFGSKVSLMTAPLLLLGKSALKTGMQFESSMSQVAATMGITKDEIAKGSKSFDMLEKAARESGKVTQYSASESAEALNYLALAGYNAEQAIETLPKVLSLASAGGLDLAYTSDLITDSASALGLEIDDLDGFIDQMARTSQKSNTNVGQLGEAILKVGANARDLKGGTLELNTAIGLLGNVGLKGSEAGTKLRNVIMAMTPTTDAAVAAFKALGVQTYDANGELKGLDNIFTDLNKSMANMTTEEKKRMISSIFNKQDMAAALSLLASTAQSTDDLNFALEELGVPMKDIDMNMDSLVGKVSEYGDEQEFASFAMKEFGLTAEQSGVLYNTLSEAIEGDSAWNSLAKEIKNSDGAAQDMSDTLNDNLEGDVKRMGSAFSEFQIALYETSNGAMSDFIVKVTEIINKLSSLDSSTLQIITAIAGIALIAGPTIVILGAIATAFGTLISVGAAIAGALLSPIGLVVTAIVGLGVALINALVPGDTFLAKLKTIGTYIMDMSRNIIPMLKNAFATVSEVFMSIVSVIVSTFMPTFNIVKTAIIDIAIAAIPFIVNAFMTLVNIVVSVGQAVINIASAVFPVLLNVFNMLVPVISDIVVILMNVGTQVLAMASKLITSLMPALTTLIQTFMNIVQTVAPGVIAVINAIISVIKVMIPIIMSIVSTVVTVIANIFSAITPVIAFIGMIINTVMAIITPIVSFIANVIASILTIIGTIVGIITGIFNTVFSVISGVFSSVNTFIAGVINRVSSKISTVSSTVSNVFNKVYNIVSSIMGRVGSRVSGVFSSIQNAWSGLTGFVNGVMSGIGTAVSDLVSKVKGAVNKVTSGINSAIGIINKIPGVSIGMIPQLQRGTDDWAGGFARMNEGGRGELTYLPNGTVVVPHDISMKYAKESARVNNNFEGNTENIGGNQYINVSLDSANIYDTRDIREISREIAQEISREVSFG
ncbi:phage tail tape measure protein [Senegalia massiliensis]|uniref:Phage tail tape measure protein n=1 Tax=Senegalia massiliensis TaxID=1720316 RepID=A0A845R3S4_9CLOT|nr:phage tail tape measure protein [Senegalia massiliensis]NBI08248.1 phage tail tape measure protein [Senegalia massiliensis]